MGMNLGSSSALEDNDDVVSEINMTPLVDVMLVLLIIFIITVPVLTHSVKLDLPRATNTLNVVQSKTITISITEDGKTHWNEEMISEVELEKRFKVAASQKDQPEIHIRGDRKVNYERVMQAMSAAQRAGIVKLGFVTDPK